MKLPLFTCLVFEISKRLYSTNIYAIQSDGQVAVTHSNKVYTWGCHPYNLRFVAHAARKARQAGKFMGDPVERYLLPEVVDTGYVHGRITKVGDHTGFFYFVGFFFNSHEHQFSLIL